MKRFRSEAAKAIVILLLAFCTEVVPRTLEENGKIVAEPIQSSHGRELGIELQNPIVENLLINAIRSSAAMISQIEGINKYAIMLNTAKKKKVDVQLLPVNDMLIDSPILDPFTIHNQVDSILKKRQENSKKFMEALNGVNNASIKTNENLKNRESLKSILPSNTKNKLYEVQPEVRALNAFTKLTEYEQSYPKQNSKDLNNINSEILNVFGIVDESISTANNTKDTTSINGNSQNLNVDGVKKTKNNGVLVKVNKLNVSSDIKVRGVKKHNVNETARVDTSNLNNEEDKENYPDLTLFNKAVRNISRRFQSHSIPEFLLEREKESRTEIPTTTTFDELEETTLNPSVKSSKSLTVKIGGFLSEDPINSQFDLNNIKIEPGQKNDKTGKHLEVSNRSESITKGGTLRKVTKVVKQPIRNSARSESNDIITTTLSNSEIETTTQTNSFSRTSASFKSSTISPITYVKSSTKTLNRVENSRHSAHAGFLNISDTNLEINVETHKSRHESENENNLHKESLLRESTSRFSLQNKENTTPSQRITTKTIVNPVTFDVKVTDKNFNSSQTFDRGLKKYVPSKFETISPFVSDSQVKQIYSEKGISQNFAPNPELDQERGPLRHINFTRQSNEITESTDGNVRINRPHTNRNPTNLKTNQESGSTDGFEYSSRVTGQYNSKLNYVNSDSTRNVNTTIENNSSNSKQDSGVTSSTATGQFNPKLAYVNSDTTRKNANRGNNQGKQYLNANQESGSTGSLEHLSRQTGQSNSKLNDVDSDSGKKRDFNSTNLNQDSKSTGGFEYSSRITGQFKSNSAKISSNTNQESILNEVSTENVRNVVRTRGNTRERVSDPNSTGSKLNNQVTIGIDSTDVDTSKIGSIDSKVTKSYLNSEIRTEKSNVKSTENSLGSYEINTNIGQSVLVTTPSSVSNTKFGSSSQNGVDSTKFSSSYVNSETITAKLNLNGTDRGRGSFNIINQVNIGQPNSASSAILRFGSRSGPDSTKFESTTITSSSSTVESNGVASSLRSGNSRITTRPYFNPGESGFGVTTTQVVKSTSSDDIKNNASSLFGTNVHQYDLELGNKNRGNAYIKDLKQKDESDNLEIQKNKANETNDRFIKTKVNINNAGVSSIRGNDASNSILINGVASSIKKEVTGSANIRNINDHSTSTLSEIRSTNGNRNILQTIDSTIKTYTTEKISSSVDENLLNKLQNTTTVNNNGILINNGLLSITDSLTRPRETFSRYNSSDKLSSPPLQDQRNSNDNEAPNLSLDLQHGATSNNKLASSFAGVRGEISNTDDKERGSKKFTPNKFDTISPFLTDSNINQLYGESQKPRFESNGKSNTFEYSDGQLTVGQEYGNDGVPKSTKTQYRGSVRYQTNPSYIDWNYGDNDFPAQFSYNYNTPTGISAYQKGTLKEINNHKVFIIKGSYQYTAPDGSPVVVNYTADENGFHPEVVTPVPNYEKKVDSDLYENENSQKITDELETTDNYDEVHNNDN